MRHSSWNTLMRMIDQIQDKYGATIHDHRSDTDLDCGQAVCAEEYGPDWMDDERFKRDDQMPDSEPVPTGSLFAAQRILDGKATWIEEDKA